MNSLIEVPISDLEVIIDEYKALAKQWWEEEVLAAWENSAKITSTQVRWFGIGNLLKPNPTYDEALAKLKAAGHKSRTYPTGYYKARLAQAGMFESIIDRYSGGDNKFFMTVEDFNMLIEGRYSNKAYWVQNNYPVDDNGDVIYDDEPVEVDNDDGSPGKK